MGSEFDTIRSAATVYAESLLELAQQAGAQAAIDEDMVALRTLWTMEPQFAAFMSSSAIDKDSRRASLRKLFASRVHPYTLNLMLVLNDKMRTGILPFVCDAFQRLLESSQGSQRVFVSTIVPLTGNQRETLSKEIRRILGVEPILVERIDPGILGGMRIQAGDRVIDRTVLRRLRDFRRKLHENSIAYMQDAKRFVSEN